MVPMHKLNTMMMPKCIGSISIADVMGRRIGVKIKIAGPISMKHPMIRSKAVMISNTVAGLSENPRMVELIAVGNPVMDMANDMAEEAARRNMITPVVSVA